MSEADELKTIMDNVLTSKRSCADVAKDFCETIQLNQSNGFWTSLFGLQCLASEFVKRFEQCSDFPRS